MAQAPSPAVPQADPTAGANGAVGAADAGADAAPDSDDNVVVTIAKNGDGTYTVYAGDEPEGGGAGDMGDMSEEDADAMPDAGAAGGAPEPTPQGQQAGSIGEALRIAMEILRADESGGGGAEDQFSAGYAADQAPTPATGPAQKY